MKASAWTTAAVWAVLCLFPLAASRAAAAAESIVHQSAHSSPSAVYRWLDITLEAGARDVDRNQPRPTILARSMAMVLTAMYDAWAAYDERAVGTRRGGSLRRPAAERTQKNKETAIAYAAHRMLLFVYPEDARWIDDQMTKMGFDPANGTIDTSRPEGVGNVAASAVIAFRAHDGANQLGDEVGGDGISSNERKY